jgi:hypothetical protein
MASRYAGWIVAVVAVLLLPDGITPYRGSIHQRSHDRSPTRSNEEGVQWVS